MSNIRRVTTVAALIALLSCTVFPKAINGRDLIKTEDLKEWLSYLASDDLEGRNTYTEGLGLAAAYIAEHLKSWGVKPAGDHGLYFQRVKVLGIKAVNRSSVTVEANGQTRTFNDGAGISFPRNVGGKRTFTSDQIEFMGYGLDAPLAKHNDYEGKDVKGKVVIWLGARGPKGLDVRTYGRALRGRNRFATDQLGAVAGIGPEGGVGQGGRGGNQQQANQQQPNQQQPNQPQANQPASENQGGNQRPGNQGGGQAGAQERPDFTTVQRLDSPIPPTVSAQDDFLEFLFSGSDIKYAELKAKAAEQDVLPRFTLKNIRITFNLDADYQVINTQYTRNVIGVVEGSDPRLKDTYVAFGAHYDHVGYAEGEVAQGPNGPRRIGARGGVKPNAIEDRIWNGADDDGSGTVTLLSVAKAFATGTKPKRSLLFVWHAGEEKGLLGSRYYADYPTIPIEKIVAQINMDMVGRNRDDKTEEANTLYLVGSDRISTELHNLTIDANTALSNPLKLDFEMNDPADLEQVYYRSDHYSYAAKGIPIVFFTTGLHPDYHFNTDSVEKINFEKMTKVAQLTYETGQRVANLDHAPVRDNKGPRVGKGSEGKIKA